MLLGGDKINGSIILLISEPCPMFGKVILCVCTSTELESTYGKQKALYYGICDKEPHAMMGPFKKKGKA